MSSETYMAYHANAEMGLKALAEFREETKEPMKAATADGLSTPVFDQIIEARHAAGQSVILVSCQLPYDAARFTDADAIVLAYCSSPMKTPPPARAATMCRTCPPRSAPALAWASRAAVSPSISPRSTGPGATRMKSCSPGAEAGEYRGGVSSDHPKDNGRGKGRRP